MVCNQKWLFKNCPRESQGAVLVSGTASPVLKDTLDIQQQSAMQLLQAIPQPPAPSVGTAGGYIDTWA